MDELDVALMRIKYLEACIKMISNAWPKSENIISRVAERILHHSPMCPSEEKGKCYF